MRVVAWISAVALCLSAAAAQAPPLQYHPNGSYLGVRLTDITPDRASALHLGDARGAEVRFVQENSPASQCGIKEGDVLLTYNGENILSAQQLGRLVGETPPGRKVKIQYWRSGKTLAIMATLDPIPARLADAGGNGDFGFPAFHPLSIADIPRMLIVWDNSPLGIESEPIESQLAQYFGVRSGVLIRAVASNSPADKAGIKAGDVITSIGTRSVAGPHDLISYMRAQQRPIATISVELVRDHKPLSKEITLDE